MATYQIIRFYRDKPKKVIMFGLTKKQAQTHCNNPETSTEKYFDGYHKVS
jgi:hypothetical protein